MPSNITVKKDDGTTDITYTAVAGAAGDKNPAVWRSNSVGSAPGQRPELRLASASNGDKTARRVDGQYTYPTVVTSGDTGEKSVVARANGSFSFILPVDMPDADVNEAASQMGNLVASAIVKAAMKSGYAPT
ncbi:TPA_asm: coat protein [ssRNA phage Gerhypos.4_66]|jgi:hypothetical protein|uniref:Coat protein n=2 Tax=Fiersviridae TaxID=2842319 RepID=A0A8S5KZ31_9VIRU|nr:coat protein [ssRNA phage Gerhypos.4_66]QDH88365.1 MAG: hypothetical protein H4Bulk48447_000003 [Leviviridae sp.]QDH90489.1 MAG: hypothetical protein H2Rhizo33875_000003 [Leviviridae sp.]DAD50452.1 TPA_asm: coat protein [ssRNA phage Gerhypos.4_66]